MVVVVTEKYTLERATEGSAGYDLRATHSGVILPGDRVLVKTGVRLEMPSYMEAQVRPRSGLALKNGVTVLNAPGTIDSDYRGEIGVILVNHSYIGFSFKEGDRIAQLVFAKVATPDIVYFGEGEWDECFPSKRSNSGFGSTGLK